ncbi:hypothetical protein F4779DRAFT_18852 [Xylariaceae sp. FL0662B]|nr:hypothetical protein F4779DRAFT_18852 [Xylariaceae sp. FL0662B]
MSSRATSKSASAFAQLLPISLQSRTVFVKCTPAPKTFYERRAVLRVLQTSSSETIETFKKLEDSSSFVAVTTKPGVATTMIENSPITRTIVSQRPNKTDAPSGASWGAQFDLRGPITQPVNPFPPSEATKATAASADLGLSHKTFTLHIFPANKNYNHKTLVSKSPLHGPWPSGGLKSFASAALRRSIPSGAMAPGLIDWDTGSQPSDDPINVAGNHAEGATSILLRRRRLTESDVRLLERARARENDSNLPEVMRSLSDFADKCARSRTATSDTQTGMQSSNTEPKSTPEEARD